MNHKPLPHEQTIEFTGEAVVPVNIAGSFTIRSKKKLTPEQTARIIKRWTKGEFIYSSQNEVDDEDIEVTSDNSEIESYLADGPLANDKIRLDSIKVNGKKIKQQ